MMPWRGDHSLPNRPLFELNLPGLVTLEPARLLSDEIDPVGIVEDADEATKLTVSSPANADSSPARPYP
jgi:hypothetical protein